MNKHMKGTISHMIRPIIALFCAVVIWGIGHNSGYEKGVKESIGKCLTSKDKIIEYMAFDHKTISVMILDRLDKLVKEKEKIEKEEQ